MKLNLHPKEFLAVYNLLNSVTPDNPDHVHLQEVRNRMRSYTISALTRKELDPPDDVLLNLWEKTQKDKISELEKLNRNLDPRNMFVEEQNEIEYPKRPPMPVVPKVGKLKVNKA